MPLSWSPPTDDGGSPSTLDYEIHWDGGLGSGAGYTVKEASTGGETSFTVTALTVGVTYIFKVKAKNEVGSSQLSASSSFLAGAVPSSPLSPTLVEQSASQIKFSWSTPSSNGGIALASYKIYWNNGAGSVYTQVGTKTASETLYT